MRFFLVCLISFISLFSVDEASAQSGGFWGSAAESFNRGMAQGAAIREADMRIEMMRIERRERRGTREIERLELLETRADQRVMQILSSIYDVPRQR